MFPLQQHYHLGIQSLLKLIKSICANDFQRIHKSLISGLTILIKVEVTGMQLVFILGTVNQKSQKESY